ncbi:MAG: hemolysin family protein [Anaerolineales bacterium]
MIVEELLLILGLIVINAFFAAVEIALVTSRRHRLRTLANEGKKEAREVLKIKEQPGHYLATVQVGITLVGTLASAVGGVAAAPIIADQIKQLIPAAITYADEIAIAFIVVLISYFSLVLGELVPKQLALRNPENLSIRFVKPILFLSRLASLPIRILSLSSEAILGLIGQRGRRDPSTSSEEIEQLMEQGTAEGIFQISEGAFVSGVLEYGDRRAHEVMRARTDIVALDDTLAPSEALDQAAKSGLSRFPIYHENLDNIIGYVHIKDLIWAEPTAQLRDIARQILFIPESASLPNIYRRLTQERVHQAIVLDEHGGTAGLLTLEDVLEVIVGEIDDEYHLTKADIRKLGEQSWLISGSTPAEDVGDAVGLQLGATENYTTLAGLLLERFGHIPKVGESVSFNGITFTVRQMNKLRIDHVMVQKEL